MNNSIVNAIRTVPEIRDHLAGRRADGESVGFVPTMGALHAGHCALIRAAAQNHDAVVVSIFVNPTQFNETSDLANYPRSEAEDIELAASAGATVCFVPSVDEIYPQGAATTIHVGGALTDRLEGAERGSNHFDGVATVVTALLHICEPDSAYFGAKDAQQVLVVRSVVRDLHIPTEVVSIATVRDADGLALSSRNQRLSSEDRRAALAIPAALGSVSKQITRNSFATSAEAARAGRALLEGAGVDCEYFAVTSPETLAPADLLDGPLLISCAARVGEVRLIDNLTVNANREAATVQ